MSSASSREGSVDSQNLGPLDADDGLSQQQQHAEEESGSGGGGLSSQSRRYLKACDNCRRRKVKCDGVRPSCGHCNRVDAPCHYSIKPKSRRMWKCLEASGSSSGGGVAASGVVAGAATVPGSGHILNNENRSALDDTTARLLARVETMERLLMQRSGTTNPSRPPAQTLAGSDEYGHHQGGGGGVLASAAGAMMSYASGGSSASASHRNSMAGGLLPDTDPRAPAAAGHGGHHHLQQTVPAKRDYSSITPDISSGYTASAASGTGSLSSPFIGSTAAVPNVHHAIGQQKHSQQPHQQSQQQQQSQQSQQQQYSFDTISHETIADVINTLFANSNHVTEIIHEESFRKQFAAGTLSPLLLYSALASAARYSKNPAVRADPPYTASAPFLARAKALVVDAIEDPSLGNAQGLMILCMMNFCLGNDVVTTSYKALALNMCILLGFNRLDSVNGSSNVHHSCGQDLVSSTVISLNWVEREAARRLWWLIFSVENYSSTCMGLAPSIQAEYCDVDLPATTLEWTKGKSQQEIDNEEASSMSPKRAHIARSPLQQLSAYHAQLSLIFSKVAWLVTRTNTNTEDAVLQFSELNSVLQRWYESLPKELRLSSVDTLLYGSQDSREYYHICVLHMRFYTTVIQLNHAIPEFTDDPSAVDSGQRKCVIAASRVSDLLRSSFEIPVDMRDMNWYMCVFRAAHIHIYRLLSRDNESIARAKQDLAIHRRHLREGGPLWRICYKLLNRLDDMEQMVMLLPAQIPVAELIRLKSLTKNGKSQLVNMQLDALIKPSLIQSEHGDSEDLPLMARAKLATIQGTTSASASTQSASGASSSTQVGGAGGMPSSQGIGFSMPVAAAAAGASIYGLLDSANNKNTADISAMHSLSTSSLGSTQVPSALSTSNGRSSTTSTSSRGGNQTFVTPSPSLSSPSLAFPSANGQMKHMSYPQHQQQQQQPDPSALQFTSSITPINTNIVIDNNMAETLVNYFYMVASNPPPNGDDKQQPNNPQSQGNGLAGGSGSGSNSSSIPGIGLDGVGHANMGMDIGGHGPLLPSATSILAAQQQQQSPSLASFVQMKGDPNAAAVQAQQHQPPHMTFGQLYDPSSGLKQVHKDHQSFV
ncbi:hypothetical protein IWW48_001281 [Coemansia sp. RSA 1200]|nr:hypothetical protein IWW48_001281 [Coemansia sp. RSA 1200]